MQLGYVLIENAGCRNELFEMVKAKWCKHPTTAETFIGVVAGLDCEDTPTIVRALINDESVFNIALAGWMLL